MTQLNEQAEPPTPFAAAVNTATEATSDLVVKDEVTLKSGVRLRIKEVPILLIRQAVSAVKMPKPPRVVVADTGKLEENPDDPEYLEAKNKWDNDTFDAGNNIMLLMGTEIIGDIPKGVRGPEDQDWVDMVRVASGIDIEDNHHARYLAWMKFIAFDSLEELMTTVSKIAVRSGISEKEVAAVADSFRNREVGGTPANVPVEVLGNGADSEEPLSGDSA